MQVRLSEAHFDGTAKVLKDVTKPPLRDVVERISGCFGTTTDSCAHIPSRDHRYDDRRTTVIMRDFEAYRDGAFFLETSPDVLSVGLCLSPSDDLEHTANAPFDSEPLRSLLAAFDPPGLSILKPPADGAEWSFVYSHGNGDSRTESSILPPVVRDPQEWLRLDEFRLEGQISRTKFFLLDQRQRGEFVQRCLDVVVRLLVIARRLAASP